MFPVDGTVTGGGLNTGKESLSHPVNIRSLFASSRRRQKGVS